MLFVPEKMKNARVRAPHKNKGSKSQCGNHRPISILPIFSYSHICHLVNLDSKEVWFDEKP